MYNLRADYTRRFIWNDILSGTLMPVAGLKASSMASASVMMLGGFHVWDEGLAANVFTGRFFNDRRRGTNAMYHGFGIG